MTTETRRPAPRSMARPATRPVAPPPVRSYAGLIAARRAREAAMERGALAGLVLLALTVSGFAGYGIATGSHDYDVRAVLPDFAGPFAWKKTVAQGRLASADLDPVTTGSLPDRPAPPQAAAAAPGPVERPTPPKAGAYALRGVADGVATLEGPGGTRQAVLGSVLPGAGRVLSIRRTGAGWMVITTETIIGPQAL
ncbi:hypothetical protein HNR00_004301 [Methylorubrum rhodinum]|uniref:Uncharacterized protein n=1 Tax=Methylorubrum rhodinum TaxID=29428 RepID=A0A840ZRU4_9HYPH|nr:hypothetical protein [Methylorubrum rhodinum]MBB5759567.1 hypothetical protein [Methylorubrum rhodinum]